MYFNTINFFSQSSGFFVSSSSIKFFNCFQTFKWFFYIHLITHFYFFNSFDYIHLSKLWYMSTSIRLQESLRGWGWQFNIKRSKLIQNDWNKYIYDVNLEIKILIISTNNNYPGNPIIVKSLFVNVWFCHLIKEFPFLIFL